MLVVLAVPVINRKDDEVNFNDICDFLQIFGSKLKETDVVSDKDELYKVPTEIKLTKEQAQALIVVFNDNSIDMELG